MSAGVLRDPPPTPGDAGGAPGSGSGGAPGGASGSEGAVPSSGGVRVRLTRPDDIPALLRLSRSIYGEEGSWKAPELLRHQEVFPEGQMVAVGPRSGRILGMVVSLVIDGDRWPPEAPWREVTDRGRLGTHDPLGDTLYGAGVAVRRDTRGMGVGTALYEAREALLRRLGLRRIRAGARISGYREVADQLGPEAYVDAVVRGERTDPTLSFQLARGFRVVAVAGDYLRTDHASLGFAAIVEWPPPEPGISPSLPDAPPAG